jgi:hypothetical protein
MKGRQFVPPDNSKILKLSSGLSNMMLFRNKMGTKFVINCHLLIQISFSVIQTIEWRNRKLNFSKRIITTANVLLIRAMMRVTSHTLPIWSTRRACKLLVHPLVIAVLTSWWGTWWRVEGLLDLHLLHLVLLIMVVLTSVIEKLVLIRCWCSSLQGLNSINDSSNGAFHPLKNRVSGLLVLCK